MCTHGTADTVVVERRRYVGFIMVDVDWWNIKAKLGALG